MLYSHQEISKEFLLKTKRAILADEPRVGKTLPTAAAALEHLPALIICPAIVKNVWKQAFERLGYTGNIRVINGKAAAKEASTDGITVINYDVLGSLNELGQYQTLVLDESHRIKSPKTIRTIASMKWMKRTPRVYALSGTPIPNRPIELWPLLHGLGVYRGGWYDFGLRYAKLWNAPWGLDTSGASNLPELRAIMQPVILRRTKAEIFKDYQHPITSLVTFDLPIDKRETKFSADALIEHPNPMLAFEGLSEVMREAGIRKVKPAAEFIESKLADEPVIVFAHHKDVVHELANILKDYKPSIITGDTPAAQRSKLIEDFQNGTTKLFIGNLAACQEGIDLSAADTVIFVEATWQTSALLQASSRVENINKTAIAPLIYLLTISNSLDHTILAKILKKQNIINQII
jgi:SNF2 family DNA or RNA helicase